MPKRLDSPKTTKTTRPRERRIPYRELDRLTGRQIATIFGISASAITQWVGRGCPRNDDKSYSLRAVVEWRAAGGADPERSPNDATAAILGVSRQALWAMVRRGCPRNEDGTYDLAAVVQWRTAELEQREARSRAVAGSGRARREQAQAELAEMQLAERRAEMLPRIALVAGWIARYRVIQSMLVAFCRRCKGYGLDPGQVATVTDDIGAILDQLAQGQPGLQLTQAEATLLRPPKLPKRTGGGEGG